VTPERRAELLAVTDRDALVELAESAIGCLGTPTVVVPPEVGLVMMQLREPVCHERFHLGEVTVTRCEVELEGHRGWAMRLGTDRVATLAAAVCDAVASGRSVWAGAVERRCHDTDARHVAQRSLEWAELAATEVRFEELDR